MGGRVGSKKYYAPDGNEYDSREEYLYLQAILDDPGISCIHRQVTITAIKPVWIMRPKQLKTKVKYERRSQLYCRLRLQGRREDCDMRCQEPLHIKAQRVLDNYKGCCGKAYRSQQKASQR